VAGAITVSNPNDWEDFSSVVLTDSFQDSNLKCTVTEPNGGVSVARSKSVTAQYSCSWTTSTPPTFSKNLNTATATWGSTYNTPDTTASGTATALWNGPTTSVNPSITIYDSFVTNPLGTVTYSQAPKSFIYTVTLNVLSGCFVYTNVVTSSVGSGATASVTVCSGWDATIGFWANVNGQALITSAGTVSGSTTCLLTAWLRNFNVNGGPYGAQISSTATCAQVASAVSTIVKATTGNVNQIRAQMMATMLASYFSQPGSNSLNAPTPIGNMLVDLTKICSNPSSTPCPASSQIDASVAFNNVHSDFVHNLILYVGNVAYNPTTSIYYQGSTTLIGDAATTFATINNGVAWVLKAPV